MITIHKTSELSIERKQQLDKLIDNEFGHIPIVKETEWAKPDWTIIYFLNGEIATFYNVIQRTIFVDKKPFQAAGINNVITAPAFRGQGFSSKVLTETKQFIFQELKRDIGLLLCADNLIPFYEKLSWYKVECPVFFEQTLGKKIWTANTMLLSVDKLLTPKEIDLNGLPW
jgi:hypothetical protein